MNSYALTPSALTDLQEIWIYIAESNPEAADELEADVFEACALLAEHPEMGSRRPGWTRQAVRFWPVRKSYLVVYAPESFPLQILRVLNAARHVPELLGGE